MIKPAVSVIIPNYNHAAYLKQRINSVLNQTYQDFELIILDDCSTDDSRLVIEKYRSEPKVTHIVYNEHNSGSTFKQWKKGIDLARGEIIWIAESDDYADVDFLTALSKNILPDISVGLVYCQSWVVDASDNKMNLVSDWFNLIDTKRWENNFENTGKAECTDYLITQNTISNASAVLFRKKIFIDVFETPTLKLCGDWLLWFKILMKCNISYVAAPLNYFRWHDKNVRSGSSGFVSELKECLYVIEYMRKLVDANTQSIKLAYKIANDRVLSRVVRSMQLNKKELRLYLNEEFAGTEIPIELKEQMDDFIEKAFGRKGRLYSILSFLNPSKK